MDPLLEIQQPSKLKVFFSKPSVLAAVFFVLGLLLMWVVLNEKPPEAPKEEVVAQVTTEGTTPEALPPLMFPNALPAPPAAKVSSTPSPAWNKLPSPPARSTPLPPLAPAPVNAPVVAAKPFVPFPSYQPPARYANDWVEKTLRGEDD